MLAVHHEPHTSKHLALISCDHSITSFLATPTSAPPMKRIMPLQIKILEKSEQFSVEGLYYCCSKAQSEY